MTEPGRHLETPALLGLALVAALVPLNSTMIAVALPDIAVDFGVAGGSTGALVTIYLVVMLAGQPVMGRLSDSVGPRRMLHVALVGFGAASAASALAPGFGLLVAGRAVQAAFGAALMPSAHALLRSLAEPARRGRSFGLLGSFTGGGAAAGPVIGGGVTELMGWRGVLAINVPIVVVALALTLAVPAARRVAPRAVPRGAVWSTLRARVFVASFLAQGATTFAQYSLLLAVPIALHGRGWSAGRIGLALASLTVGMVLLGPAGGRAGDLLGRRHPVLRGVGLGVASMVVAVLTVESSPAGTVAAMALFGVGLGYAIPSIQTAALESVPEEQAGSAAGVLSMSRYTGSIPASVLLAILVGDDGAGARVLLALSLAAMVVALAVSTRLPGRRADAGPSVSPGRGSTAS